MTLQQICLIILLPLSILSLLLSCALYNRTKEQKEENEETRRKIENLIIWLHRIDQRISLMDKQYNELKNKPEKLTVSDVLAKYFQDTLNKNLEKEEEGEVNIVD